MVFSSIFATQTIKKAKNMDIKIKKVSTSIKASIAAEIIWNAAMSLENEMQNTTDCFRKCMLECYYNEAMRLHKWIVESINRCAAEGTSQLLL